MPDPLLILEALAAAALTAAALFLLFRLVRPIRTSAGVLSVGAGFYVGCRWLGLRPHWPPVEDLDRSLLLLFPALIAVELIAFLPQIGRWMAWPLRILLSAGAARLLLHNTSYLADLGLPGTPEWTPLQTWSILGGLAAALAGVWVALIVLARRTQSRAVPLALAVACAGASATVMLSGYAFGSQMGLPLAAALAGALAASLALSDTPDLSGVIGLGVVGLFTLLVVGRFFGTLTTTNAVLLFGAPLLCWLPGLPPRYCGFVRVLWAAVPVALALMLARAKFVEDENRPSSAPKPPSSQVPSDTKETTLEDYLDPRK